VRAEQALRVGSNRLVMLPDTGSSCENGVLALLHQRNRFWPRTMVLDGILLQLATESLTAACAIASHHLGRQLLGR
jgi:hypothetical protein